MSKLCVAGRPSTGQPVRRTLRRLLEKRGIHPSSEAGRLLQQWITDDLAQQDPLDWSAQVTQAVDLGLAIYEDFNRQFTKFFDEAGELTVSGPGTRNIDRWLRRRFAFHHGGVYQRLTEAVLNIIHNRRLHYLDQFRRRYQPSLFGPRTWEPEKTLGYLVRVAFHESYHVPSAVLEELRRSVDGVIVSACGTDHSSGARHNGRRLLTQPSCPPAASSADALGPEEPPSGTPPLASSRYELPDRLRRYWTRENGFSRAEQLEGLVSAGFGAATGIPELQLACQMCLNQRHQRWQPALEDLQARRNWVQNKCAHLEAMLRHIYDPRQKFLLSLKLARLQQRRDRLDRLIDRHWPRLRPRPSDVQRILHSFVRNPGTVRFRRISQELAVWEARVHQGTQRVLAEPRQPGLGLPRLVQQVLELLDAKPAESPSAHGLSEKERQRRKTLSEVWQQRARGLLGQVRQMLRTLGQQGNPAPWAEPAICWLADCEDLLQFGIDRQGVLQAVRHRRGWRLDHLLRIGDF